MSNIEWTEETWNPVVGCSKVSEGCRNCYAMPMAKRLASMAAADLARGLNPGRKDAYARVVKYKDGVPLPQWNGHVECVADALTIPLGWKKPRTVFVNSMGDLFHEDVPFDFIDRVFAVMALCPQHTFQVLTKHPDRMQQWFGEWVTRLSGSWGPAHPSYVCAYEMCRELMKRDGSFAHEQYWREYGTKADVASWPLPNVWMGVTVEDRKYGVPRIARLRATPAAKRFLSAEPLLEDLGTIDLSGIDLVIAGAESGRRARPLNEDWVRSLRDQCAAQGVAFFYKQRLNERGHKVSLPLLDGVRHDVMP